MEEERVDGIKRNICFGGQDFLCEPLGIILDELVRLWVQMGNTSCGCIGKLKAVSGLVTEGEAVLWVVFGLKSVWDDGFWIVGLPLNQSWGHPCCLFPRCPDFRRWATALARVFKKKSRMQCPFHPWALLWSYQENPWPFWLGGRTLASTLRPCPLAEPGLWPDPGLAPSVGMTCICSRCLNPSGLSLPQPASGYLSYTQRRNLLSPVSTALEGW